MFGKIFFMCILSLLMYLVLLQKDNYLKSKYYLETASPKKERKVHILYIISKILLYLSLVMICIRTVFAFTLKEETKFLLADMIFYCDILIISIFVFINSYIIIFWLLESHRPYRTDNYTFKGEIPIYSIVPWISSIILFFYALNKISILFNSLS